MAMKLVRRCAALVGLAVALGGCAGMPESDMLDQARAEFSAAEQQDRIYDFAGRPMRQAAQHLRQAEALQAESESLNAIEHHAFMARQYLAIAAARLERGLTQEQIGRADQRRQALILEAEGRRAERATERASAAESALESARAELETAEERARTLSEKVSELEVAVDERGTVFTISDVVFDFDSDELKEGGERALAQVADAIEDYPEGRITVDGYTDSIGDETYNQRLSERRAEAVKEALVAQGLEADRIRTRGQGEAYPVASNDTAAGRQMNRRVEIVVEASGQQPATGTGAAAADEPMR